MAASDVIPGLFMLPLPINKDINIDKDVVETKLRDLDHFLSVRRGRSEELAILNLQGLLTLRLRRHEDAVGYFQAVLKRDPENLNALANLQYVLEKLFRLTEAIEYKEERNKIIRNTSVKGAQTRNARCLAEQAYAYAYDIHSETIGGWRYEESNNLYREALILGGTAVESLEKDDWKFCMAINAHKLFDSLFYELGKTSALEEYIDIVVKLFFEVIQSVPGDPELQWDSWRHLADLFRGMKIRKIERDVSPEWQEFKDNPEKCMLKAMEVSPGNARLLARYANFLFSLDKKKLGKPLELLEQSISLDSSEFNFYAFTTRAMINIKFYENQLESSGQDDSNQSVLRCVLQLAQTDLEKAMSMHVTPWDLARLGKAYYLLANHHTEQDIEIRSLIEKALLYFTKAADCQDGYKREEVHLMRGRCLFAIGENHSAVGCYKQAIDCESKTSTYTGNFNELLNVYLSMLRDKENIKDNSIVAEISFSLQKALLKYKRPNMTKHCIFKYRFKYKSELQELEKYCKQFEELHEVASILNTSGKPPKPSQGKPITEGGTLRQSWNNTRRYYQVKHVPSEERTRGDTTAPRDYLSSAAKQRKPYLTKQRWAAGGKEDEEKPVERAEDVSSLEQGVKQIDIQEPKQPIRKAPDEARTSNFEYDFYVIYPESEQHWVSYRLLDELEEIRKLKGCIHDRDKIAGTLKIKSQLDLMEKCANIVLVINKDRSTKFIDDMIYALTMRRRREYPMQIIPVLRDNSKVPIEIDLLLNCVDATGAVNWDLLALNIEQQV